MNRTWTLVIPAPAPLISLNQRLHWAKRNTLTQAWRTAGYYAAYKAKLPKRDVQRASTTGYVHKTTRRRYDVHNLMPTFKAIIDGALVDYLFLPDDSNEYLTGPDLRVGSVMPATTIRLTITEEA